MFFPERRAWNRRRVINSGAHSLTVHMSSTGADVAFSYAETLPSTLCGTVLMVSKHGDGDFWLRARHKDPQVHVTWQMRRNHDRKMEFRTTGYHEDLAQLVCDCVSGGGEQYLYVVETLGESFADFSTAARAAILNEINERCLPRRLAELVPRSGIKTERIDALVVTSRHHELPNAG